MAKVTLEEVAKYAHVSRGTVDRVIHKRGNVKPVIEERVKEALDILGYERNKIASALASSKYTRKVCLIDQKAVTQYFEEKAEKGIVDAKKELNDFGIEVERITLESSDPNTYRKKIYEMLDEGVNGFALRIPYDGQVVECINQLAKKSIPVITFNTDIPESSRDCFVGENLYQSGKIAGHLMARLIRQGEKVLIGYGFPQYFAHHRRVAGFMDEMKKTGICEADMITFYTDQDFNKTMKLLKKLFEEENNIRGIYMSIEPNEACGKFLEEKKLEKRPFVICHDIDPITIKYMNSGIFDFVIDQNIEMQYYQALIILKDILCFGTWDYRNDSKSYVYSAAYFE